MDLWISSNECKGACERPDIQYFWFNLISSYYHRGIQRNPGQILPAVDVC